jgi:hypothetical protein
MATTGNYFTPFEIKIFNESKHYPKWYRRQIMAMHKKMRDDGRTVFTCEEKSTIDKLNFLWASTLHVYALTRLANRPLGSFVWFYNPNKNGEF